MVNDQQPYKTLKEFVDDAKKRPDEIIFSSSGLYGALHIPTALFMKAAGGLKMRHLPTNGGGPALTAFLGNNAQVLVSSISASLRADQGRQGCAARAVRRQALQGAAGRADHEGTRLRRRILSLGRHVRAEGHAGQRDRLSAHEAINKAAHTDQFKTAMTNLGQELGYLDQADFAKFWDADAKRIEDAVSRSAACRDNGANARTFVNAARVTIR